MKYQHDPDGTRLPVKLDSTSNGEFEPVALAPVHHAARHEALAAVDRNSRCLAMGRREFLVSACGTAATLLAMNDAYARAGSRGGFFELPRESGLDLHAARSALDKSEMIFDVQGHFVNPTGAWTKALPETARPLRMPKTQSCGPAKGPGQLDYLQCIGPDEFVKDVFMDSDTGPHGAVVRAFDARIRAAHHRGGVRHRAHRGEARRHASPAHPRTREPEPEGRPRGHGRARRALSHRRVEDVHAVGTRRQGLLARRRRRHRLHREGEGSWACATSPSTRASRSGRAPTSTRPAPTWAAWRSDSPT
jgi:hypothetical protein